MCRISAWKYFEGWREFTTCSRITPFDQLTNLPSQHPPSGPSLELETTAPVTTISALLYEFWYSDNDGCWVVMQAKVYIYYRMWHSVAGLLESR